MANAHIKRLQNQQRMPFIPPPPPQQLPFYNHQQQPYNSQLFSLLHQQQLHFEMGAGESMCSKADLNSSEFLLPMQQQLPQQNPRIYNGVFFVL